MNSQDFLLALKLVVEEGSTRAILRSLTAQPHRTIPDDIVQLIEWYQLMSVEERALVDKVVQMASRQALYNFLLVLDGDLSIEQGDPKSRIELIIKDNNSVRTVLTSGEGPSLASQYKDIVA